MNAEWAVVVNHGGKARDLTGWKVRDPEGHIFKFPTFKLPPGKSVRLHTGRGTNTARDLYWKQDSYIWNNEGDKAVVKNKAGTVVDTCSWGSGGGSVNC